jgi:hypothetical protein
MLRSIGVALNGGYVSQRNTNGLELEFDPDLLVSIAIPADLCTVKF